MSQSRPLTKTSHRTIQFLSNRAFWHSLGLSLILALCLAGMSACSENVDQCNETKACPTGQSCVSGKCVAQEGSTDKEKAAQNEQSTPDGGTTEQLPEEIKEVAPEKPPLPKIYKWRKSTSGSADLWGVHMFDNKLAWVVGDKGTVLHTQDGGRTWKKQTSGITTALYSVHFSSAKEGWAVGKGGIALHTTNGGTSWKKKVAPTKEDLRDVFFVDENHGWIVGNNFTLLRTRTKGSSWGSVSESLNFNLHSVHFNSRNDGYIAGSHGTLINTRDGAQKITTLVTGTQDIFYGISFFDDNNGWAVGEAGAMRKSEDRGEGWDKMDSGVKQDLHDVAFISLKRGWIVGKGGTFSVTRDAGRVWSPVLKDKLPDLYAISVKSDKAGIVVGKAGTIIFLNEEEGECVPDTEQECYTGPASTKGVGTCKAGKQKCENGKWGPCDGQILPEPKEVCHNGEDNNCNGKSDSEDGCPACEEKQTRSCYTGPKPTTGTGACRPGTQTCTNKAWGKCEGQTLPKEEDCNGIDDNCDGKIDNDIKIKKACAISYGVCASGSQTCSKGKWVACKATDYGKDYEKKESKCDGKDNDCNGIIDEYCACKKDGEKRPCYSGRKGTEGKGLCKKGEQVCTKGKWTGCQNQVTPAREICQDKKDNDCDGQIDEKTQYALSLDGRGSYGILTYNKATNLQTFTIEGWFYPAYLNRRAQALVSRSEYDGYGLYVDYPRRGQVTFRVYPEGGRTYVSATASIKGRLSNYKWHHVAGTFDGKMVRLWINGKKAAEKAHNGKVKYSRSEVPLILGAEAGVKTVARDARYFVGRITNVKLSNKALYTKDFTPSCILNIDGSTVGLWPVDEGTGEVLGDKNGSLHIKRVKGTWRESIRCKGFHPGGCVTPKRP